MNSRKRISFAVLSPAVLALTQVACSPVPLAQVDQPQAKPPLEAVSSIKTKERCAPPKQRVQAADVIYDWDLLTYPDYVIQTKYKRAIPELLQVDRPLAQPQKNSYILVRHRGKIVAKFDAHLYSPLGNSTSAGWFSLLNNGRDQLVISQEISRTGVQWVADFEKGFRIIFNGQRFAVGRESEDMTMSDLDGDGILEITVPLTDFYGFEKWRLTTMETPLPDIIFKYDPTRGEYLPANPNFKECLLKDIDEAAANKPTMNDQTSRGWQMSIVLDYVFVGEEQRAWKFFEETCKLPDKARIKADIKRKLKNHPVYRYLQVWQSTLNQRHLVHKNGP